MQVPLFKLRVGASATLFVMAGLASVAPPENDMAPPTSSRPPVQMVEWLGPAFASNPPPVEKDKEGFRAHGRQEPKPESLQPSLDPALPAYQPRTDVKLSGSLKGACSDTLPGQAKAWFDAFKKYYPAVDINIPPPYAGSTGARDLIKGTTDFVFVARELKPEDYTDFKARFGYDPLVVPVSGASYRHFGFTDAHVFFVNKANPLEKISFDQLDAIFSSTHHRGGKPITTWGQLGLTGEWADKPIHLYGIKPWNGFEEYIRQRVLSRDGRRGEWRDGITLDDLVFQNARRVAEDRYGIGYCGVSDVDAGVRILPLSESANGPFYAPTYENVASAAYPLSRLLYFATNKPPGKPLTPVLGELLRFILSRQGQQVVLKHAVYLPLRSEQMTDARAAMNGGTRASRFFLAVPYNLASPR
jgi:phosphate transport system substrate-binding protein